MKIGAQLFTTREFCKDLPSFAETLKKVADIGYTTVQVSGTCEYEPADAGSFSSGRQRDLGLD